MRAVSWALGALSAVALLAPAQRLRADDPKLDAHLERWEKRMKDATNLASDVELTRSDSVLKRDAKYTGSVLCMKPNFARLRLDNVDDPKKQDYEAFICTGKSVFAYNGVAKTVTEFELPKAGPGVDNLMLDFLAGMKAKDIKERFKVTLYNADEHYIYLDIKPVLGKDQREFKQIRFALYGPGPKTAAVSYLPAAAHIFKPNDDIEAWKFSNVKVDVPNVDAKLFQYVEIKDWQLQKAPPQPIGGGAKPGTEVRPNKP